MNANMSSFDQSTATNNENNSNNNTEIDPLLLFDEQCEQAAEALAQADVLLLVTGAGWSADSGLAIYKDIGKVSAYEQLGLEYADVCQPKWIQQNPALFYGFWGQCFNDYRTTKPHEGYDIVTKWRNDKNNKAIKIAKDIQTLVQDKVDRQRPFDSEETQRLTPYDAGTGQAGAFFAFTSNADAHFYDYLHAYEIHDCHGNIELWQCSDRDCHSGIWRAPVDYKFLVNKQTMLAPPRKDTVESNNNDDDDAVIEKTFNHSVTKNDVVPRIGHTTGRGQRTNPLRYMPKATDVTGWYHHPENSVANDDDDDDGDDKNNNTNWPKCGHCHNLARPAIFMFGDFGWKYDMSQSIRWDLWKEAVVDLSAAAQQHNENGIGLNVCIVEVGCGLNVPTCRSVSEQMVEDVLEKGGNVKLVRINPDFPSSSDQAVQDNLISIQSKGLRAIKRIDEFYMQKLL